MNKVNLFPALMARCSFVVLSKLCNIDEVALVANLGKTYSTKQTARSTSVFSASVTHHVT